MSALFLLPWKSEAFLYVVPSVLQLVEMEVYFLFFFFVLATIRSQPQNLYADLFFTHINHPRQFQVGIGIRGKAGT